MKKVFLCILICFMAFIFAGCTNSEIEKNTFTQGSNPDTGILVVYFSRTGEQINLLQKIKIGNTAIVGNMIAEKTGADIFEIMPVEDNYPKKLEDLKKYVKKEKEDNARPAILDKPDNLDKYDTIFIGYPIWDEDMPMIVYTFLESYDFSDKTVIPFCTHGWSGFYETKNKIADITKPKEMKDGFEIKGHVAQNRQEMTKRRVDKWLNSIGY